jgi:hypothetical protein
MRFEPGIPWSNKDLFFYEKEKGAKKRKKKKRDWLENMGSRWVHVRQETRPVLLPRPSDQLLRKNRSVARVKKSIKGGSFNLVALCICFFDNFEKTAQKKRGKITQ